MQRVFAKHAFGPSKCRWFSVDLDHSKGSSYRFAKTLLLFDVTLCGTDSEEEELSFIQYFEVIFAVDGIEEELNCVCLV